MDFGCGAFLQDTAYTQGCSWASHGPAEVQLRGFSLLKPGWDYCWSQVDLGGGVRGANSHPCRQPSAPTVPWAGAGAGAASPTKTPMGVAERGFGVQARKGLDCSAPLRAHRVPLGQAPHAQGCWGQALGNSSIPMNSVFHRNPVLQPTRVDPPPTLPRQGSDDLVPGPPTHPFRRGQEIIWGWIFFLPRLSQGGCSFLGTGAIPGGILLWQLLRRWHMSCSPALLRNRELMRKFRPNSGHTQHGLGTGTGGLAGTAPHISWQSVAKPTRLVFRGQQRGTRSSWAGAELETWCGKHWWPPSTWFCLPWFMDGWGPRQKPDRLVWPQGRRRSPWRSCTRLKMMDFDSDTSFKATLHRELADESTCRGMLPDLGIAQPGQEPKVSPLLGWMQLILQSAARLLLAGLGAWAGVGMKWDWALGPANSPQHPPCLGLGQPAQHKQTPLVGAEGLLYFAGKEGLGLLHCPCLLWDHHGGSAGGREKAWASLTCGWVFP
ncbi:hypothetical protein DV515_00018183, partial [Chloebia gouldiae]